MGGLAMAGFGAYELLTYVPPKPSPMDAMITSPFAQYAVPLMWFAFAGGVLFALNSWRKAWADAHP